MEEERAGGGGERESMRESMRVREKVKDKMKREKDLETESEEKGREEKQGATERVGINPKAITKEEEDERQKGKMDTAVRMRNTSSLIISAYLSSSCRA